MVIGVMPREPKWLYSSGRSAMRQMFAASSRTTSSGGSSRPPAASAARVAARRIRSVSAATSGGGSAGAVLGQQVQRLARGGERGGLELIELVAGRRRGPGPDCLVAQAVGGGAGGLVDAVAGLGCAVHPAEEGRRRGAVARGAQ